MRKINLLMLWCIIFTCNIGYAQNEERSLDSIYHYGWRNCWELSMRERTLHLSSTNKVHLIELYNNYFVDDFNVYDSIILKYDLSGRLIEKTLYVIDYIYDPETGEYTTETEVELSKKNEYVYDANGNLLVQKGHTYDDEDWTLISLDSNIYNAIDQLVESVNRTYSLSGSIISTGYCEWEYNANGDIIIETKGTIDDNVKEKDKITIFEYSGGVPTVLTTFRYGGSEDSVYYKKETRVYSGSNLMQSTISFYSDDLGWEDKEIIDYTYDEVGNLLSTEESKYINSQSHWLPTTRELYNTSEERGVSETTDYSWAFYYWKRLTKTVKFYRGSVIREADISLCESNSYTVFLSGGCPVSVFEQEQVDKSLFVYPNPNHGELNIRLHDPQTSYHTIEVYSMEGKLVFQQDLPNYLTGEEYTINLRDLDSGFYLVQLSSANTIYRVKIIIDN